MVYPAYIPTRIVSIGGAMGLEDSSVLLSTKVIITSNRSLVWDDTGYRFERIGYDGTSEAGAEILVELPRTDVPGWRDPAMNALIDVSVPGSYTHQYTAKISFIDDRGRTRGQPFTLGPFVVPSDAGIIDLDKLIPVSTVAGQMISIPDAWGQAVADAESAAQAAADSAASMVTPSDAFIASQIENPASQTTTALNAAFVRPADIVFPAGLVAFWDFSEPAAPFRSRGGAGTFPLTDGAGSTVTRTNEGPFGSAVQFDGTTDYLVIPGTDVGALNVAATGDEVTVCAWVKRTGPNNSFIAGMWQEDNNDPRRQYGLFLDLPTYGGDNRVCGHVSRTGGASPGLQYSRDYSATARAVMDTGWNFIAFTYDGDQIVSYLDGLPDSYTTYTEPSSPIGEGLTYDKNPYDFDLGLNRSSVSDFTVGSVKLTAGMSNYLAGQVTGVGVFNRALTQVEIMRLYLAMKPAADPIAAFSFAYPGTAVSRPTKQQGWRSVRGTTETTNFYPPYHYPDPSNFAFTTLSGQQFMFRSSSIEPENLSNAGVGWFDTFGGVRLSQIDRIEFDMNGALMADKVRFVIRVGSAWYATEQEFGMSANGATGGNWATAEHKTFDVERTAALWRDLTLVPGSSFALAGSARIADLPNGEVTAVGFYSPALVDTSSNVRLRNLHIY